MVTHTLALVIWLRGRPKKLLHRSDQGSQYMNEPFQRLMADHGIICSPLGGMPCVRLPGNG
jgi:putative transposase